MQVRAGVKQGEFFKNKSWISYNTQTAQVLSLAMRIFKVLADRDLPLLRLWVVYDLSFGDCQEVWLDPVFVFSL